MLNWLHDRVVGLRTLGLISAFIAIDVLQAQNVLPPFLPSSLQPYWPEMQLAAIAYLRVVTTGPVKWLANKVQ